VEYDVRGLAVEQLCEREKRWEILSERIPKATPAPGVKSVAGVARDIDVVLMELEVCVYRGRHDLAASWYAHSELDRLGFEEVSCNIG
jgi:hypothetical protein